LVVLLAVLHPFLDVALLHQIQVVFSEVFFVCAVGEEQDAVQGDFS
jgi:hypothetical protein